MSRIPVPSLLKWAGTIGLGWLVLSKTDLAAIARVASRANLGLLGAAVGLYAVDRFTAAHRWRILYAAAGHPLGLWRATRVYVESSFLGAALPATVGGDLIRARMVATDGASFSSAVGSVVLERLLGTLALIVAAALGLTLFGPEATRVDAGPSVAVAAVTVAIAAALIFAPRVPRGSRGRGWIGTLLAFLGDVHGHVRGYSKQTGVLALSTGIAFVQQYLFLFINWIVARALELPLDLGSMLWMWPIVMLAVRLPFSFVGFGVREAVLLGLFASVGLSADSAVSLGLLSGLLDLLFIGIGGILLLASRFETPLRPS